MLPAPSLREVRNTLRRKPAALIGLLFAPPYTRVGKGTIVPRIAYLDERSGRFIHFFCAGYSGYGNEDYGALVCSLEYDNGTVIPWRFGERQFAQFVKEVESVTSWRYSGECDLILVDPRFSFADKCPDIEFSEAVVFNIEAMVKDGAIDSAAGLFEVIMRFAREHEWSANVGDLSDKQGMRVLGDAAAKTILDLLPKAARGIWEKGVHYRVQNLAR